MENWCGRSVWCDHRIKYMRHLYREVNGVGREAIRWRSCGSRKQEDRLDLQKTDVGLAEDGMDLGQG